MTKPDDAEPFFGIDRFHVERDATTFANAATAPLTLEAIEAGIRAIEAMKPPVPCGSDAEHPHITRPVSLPADRGEPVQCVNCGTWVAYTSENRGVDLGGPGLFTEMLYRWKLPIVAEPSLPPDTGYLVPSTLTAAEQAEAEARVKAGEDALAVAVDIKARRALKVRFEP